MQVPHQLSERHPDARVRAAAELLARYRVHMVSAVLWKNTAPWDLARRQCWDSFFLIPMRGAFRVTLEEGEFDVRPGEFLMLSEGVHHAIRFVGPGTRLHQISIHCYLLDAFGAPLLPRFAGHLRGVLRHKAWWFESLQDLVCTIHRDPALGQIHGEALMRLLLTEQLWLAAPWIETPAARDPRVEAALRLIGQRCGVGVTVSELARAVNLSEVQFRKIFARDVKQSPKTFLLNTQLSEAARLLRETPLSVKQIAAETGFANDHHFHLAFRRHFRCTPSRYRMGGEGL